MNITTQDKNATRIAVSNGLHGAALLHRTWFRDINGNSYQSGALYLNGRIVKAWGKDYQGNTITEDAKQLRAEGVEFNEVITATRLKDFYTEADSVLTLEQVAKLYA